MRPASVALAALLLPAAAFAAAADADPFSRDAGDVLRRQVDALRHLEGYSLECNGSGMGFGNSWPVKVKRDSLAVFEGDPAVYVKEDDALANIGGTLTPVGEVPDVDGVRVCLALHPDMILEHVRHVAGSAEYAGDEAFEERVCRVVTAHGDPQFAFSQLTMMLGRPMMLRANAQQTLRRIDPARTSTSYRVWLDSSTAQIVKIEWQLVPGIPENAQNQTAPGTSESGEAASLEGFLENLQMNYVLTFRSYEEPEWTLPEEVTRRFHIRERPHRGGDR